MHARFSSPTGRLTDKQRGFTLLEVLVAIGVFSVVAMVSYTTLDTYLDQRERLVVHYGKLERLQRLFILLERDIQFAARRKVRDGGEVRNAIESEDGDALISLTVAQADVLSATGISLKRVQWHLDGKELIRAQWDVLDHSGNIEPAELLVIDEVENVEFNYMVYSANQSLDIDSRLEPNAFPVGIELTVTMSSGEQYQRLFAVAQGG